MLLFYVFSGIVPRFDGKGAVLESPWISKNVIYEKTGLCLSFSYLLSAYSGSSVRFILLTSSNVSVWSLHGYQGQTWLTGQVSFIPSEDFKVQCLSSSIIWLILGVKPVNLTRHVKQLIPGSQWEVNPIEPRSAYHSAENWNGTVDPGGNFLEKSNTFRGITFSPLLLKRPKFSVPFVRITSAKLHLERKWKIYRYCVNGTTQYPFCFWCQKKYQYHLTEIFHQNFRINGKRSREIIARIQRKTSQVFTQKI